MHIIYLILSGFSDTIHTSSRGLYISSIHYVAEVAFNQVEKKPEYCYWFDPAFASVAKNKMQLPKMTVPTTVKVIWVFHPLCTKAAL